MPKIDIEDYLEYDDASGKPKGGGGGKGEKQGKKTIVAKRRAVIVGSRRNVAGERRGTVSSPNDEVRAVIKGVLAKDKGQGGRENLDRYVAWVERVLSGGELVIDGELSSFERFTAGGPGGSGKDTSNTVRRITHYPTGIQAEYSDRSAQDNERISTQNLEDRLRGHLGTWRLLVVGLSGSARSQVESKVGELVKGVAGTGLGI